jgi:UDP-N-acetylglucosamine--N-acetylmuramyl-(pentapeptide) pyrophosphoryl-undecaprenol N-acetylglucosamine transferase
MSGTRWLLAGGGTGGHVTMALALGEAIAQRGEAVLFVGTERGLEGRLVPAAGFDLVTLPGGQVMGTRALARIAALANLARAALAALGVLRRFAPDVVVSVGGYAAVPAVAAARLRRTPVALVEPNAVPGRANRATGRFARRVYLAFEVAAQAFPRARAGGGIRVTGVPLRRALAHSTADSEARPEPKPPLRLLVFGGSQGARQINDAALDALPRLDPKELQIAHQTGEADRARVAEGYARAGFAAEVFSFDADMPRRYRWADLAVCRSGAITVGELALAGLPALLVPYPFAADDHQRANARELARAGAACMVEPLALDGARLAEALGPLVAEPERLVEMRRRARALARPDAAREIVEDCRALVAREKGEA